MNTNCEKVNKIMAIVIDASITKEQAMEVLRVKYEWLYPYITNGVWDDHYRLYLKSKGVLLETKCGCVIMRDSREHDECRCDDDGENWICAGCYNGEYDDKPECCGKHCDETEGLKLGMGWNRWHLSVTDMITEQLWCVNCYKDYVGNECKSCCEYYPYTEMTYHEGGAFGDDPWSSAMFFCKSCVDNINSIDYNPDEYDDNDCICAGCEHEIDEDGFCSENCNYENTGFWTCKKCSNKCENVEVCPNCDDDDCICVTDEDGNVTANKNCNEHNCCKVCSKCVECKFNDVAWLCADCQKNIDYEPDEEE